MTQSIVQILDETVSRLFRNEVTAQGLRQFEKGLFPDGLWTRIDELGLADVLLTEEETPWAAACALYKATGRYAAPVPLAEFSAASFLANRAGLDRSGDRITLATCSDWSFDGTVLSATVSRIPWARLADAVLLENTATQESVLVSLEDAVLEHGVNIAFEPRDEATFTGVPIIAALPAPANARLSVREAGAFIRACQMAGAIEGLLAAAVQYVQDREQFGRPLSKFQAIQQQLAVLAGRSAAVDCAARGAADALDAGRQTSHIAIAKIESGESVAECTSIAHQVHGAIGFTYEHDLHFLTRRLWAWRNEFGATQEWSIQLGQKIAARGAANLWPDLTEL